MNSTMPLLSLCIPTYNRAALLWQAMAAIMDQITLPHAADVEVVISDNASSDHTSQIIAQAQAAYPHVRLRSHRRDCNDGPDANIYQTVRLAEGEFVYILSDDDVLMPGAVETLLHLIKTYPHLDAFTLNVQVFRDDLHSALPAEIPLESDVAITNKNEALLLLNTWLRYISAMAFRRTLVCDKDYSSRVGTYFIQAYIFLDVLSSGRGLLITALPYLAQRDGNMTVFDYCRVYVTNFSDLMSYASALGFARHPIRVIHQKNVCIIRDVVYSNTILASWQAFLPDTRDATMRLLRVYPLNLTVLFLIVPVLLIPPRVVPFLYNFYKRVKTSLMPNAEQL